MKFREKKEYYSLRKFKGVGLASAVIGAMLLSPSVLAEEVQTDNQKAQIAEKSPTEDASEVAKDVKQNQEKVEIVSQSKEVSKQKTEEHSKIVSNEVDSPKTSSEENSQEISKIAKNAETSKDSKTSERTEDKPKSRKRRDTSSQESEFVSEKAKEVVRELNDTLVMKNEDTASTSDTLFKLDEGVKPTEEEKAYVKAIKDAFNDMPELVRSSVNSLTIVRKLNGLYGYTYSKEGNVNMNMQYYHPELTNGEPGSLQQSVSVLGHEVGHIFNAKSFRDGDTWSFSRDPKYAELVKDVYGDSMTDNIHGRWASDFGSYVGWISGKSTPQTDGERKIYTYMDSLFKGILTPREDRITPELKSAVEAAKAGGKRLVYDGHVEFTADYKNVNDVKQKVQTLNSSEVGKIATSTHYKTYGYKTLVTTKYTSNGSDIGESTLTKNESSQLDIPGYNFVTKEVSHDGLLVEYKYAAKNTYSLDNDKLSADLDIQKGPSFIGDKNKANFRFTVKQPVNNLRLSYTIQNLTTGVYQTDSGKIGEAHVSSTNLKGASKQLHYTHNLGATEGGYHASADLTYELYTGAQGDNVYRMTVKILDGATEIGSVSKDFVGNVVANKEHDLQGITLKSQTDLKDGKTIGAIVKNGNLYRPVIAAIGNINRDTKLANAEISKVRRDTMYPGSNGFDSVSKDAYVRYTILNSDYRLTNSRLETLSVLKDLKDGDTQAYLRAGLNEPLSKKDDLGYTVATYGSRDNGSGVLMDSVGSFAYVGNDKSARTDKVPIKIELLKIIDGKETVIDSTTVTKDVEIVNYDESLKPFFADDFQVRRRSNLGIATKSGDKYNVHKGRYGTGLEHARLWSYDKWSDGSSDSIERYRLSDVDSNKHVFLENLIGINIKQPTDAVFSDVDYTVHMDVFKRNDNKPLNFSEITLRLFVNRESILSTKDYKETVYWLDESGTRHLVGSNVSTTNEIFSNSYSIPTNAKSIEVDVTGKVPIQYAPSFLAQYITDDTFEKIRDENRFLNSKEGDTFDSRAYSVTSSLTDKLLNKKRDFKNQAIVRNKEILDDQTLLNIIGADKNNVRLNQPFRLSSNQVGLASSNGQLTSNNLLNTTELLADNSSKQFVLLEEGVQLSDTGWSKDSTFSFSGKTYTLYTKPWDKGKDINESDFSANAMISPLSSNLVANKTYDVFTGLIFKVKEGVSVIDHEEGDTLAYYTDKIENKRLDSKILELLGKSSSGSKDNLNKLIGRKLVLNTKRSLEFTVNQTVEDSSVVTRDYAKSAGKQVDVAVTLSNGSQTTSPTLEVIQKLPVGDLNYTFVSPKENSNYTVFYTSDDDVSSDSNWSSSKPARVTGLKWVRKSALNTGTIDKVAYTIQVSNDKSHVTKSIASATIKNGNLIGTVNDVAIRNDQEYRKLVIRKEVYDAIGNLIENVDVDVLSLPVGESVRYLDAVSGYFLNSVSDGSATQTGTDYTLPVVKANAWGDKTFTVPNRDTMMVFKFVKQAESLEARRSYTTTWDNGYVEPDVQKLAKLFNNVRTFEFLPNESSQAVKKFKLTYDSGIKGFGFVDINIDPKRDDVVEPHKVIRYQGDEEKDLGYKETTPGNNHTYTNVKSYTADETGTFHESVTTENDVPARDAVVTLGTKPTIKTENIEKGKRYEADPDQDVKGKETVIDGQDGVKKSTTRYTVNPTTGDITSNTAVETTDKVDTVVKVGNKEVLTETIDATKRYKAEPSLEKDVRETETNGQDGSREITVTYEVDPSDGTLSNPTRTTRETAVMTPTVIKVGSVHKDIVETEITTKYISDDTKVRDTREEISSGSKGVKTTTTTYEVDENTGTTHSPTTQVDDEPMVQRVIKIGTKPTIEIEPISITTRYIFDENLAYGQQIVEEKGSEGRVVTTTTYTMNESDGTTTADTPDVQTVPMVQRVIRIGVKPTVEETPIDFNTFYEPDPDADKDSKVDKVAGKVGKLITTTTYSYDPNTGIVTPNQPTTQKEESIDRIVKVGTRPKVVETPIEFTSTYDADPESQRDSKVDKVVGKNGTTTVTTTYSVDPKTGVVTENPSTTAVKDPVNAVIKVGTKSTEVVETLPSPKRFVKDPTRPKDEEPTTEQGRTGSKTTVTTYSVDPKTGVTTPNEQPPVTIEPTDTVVKVPAGDKITEEKIAITTRYIEDPTKEVGFEEEISKGSEGKIVTTTTYNVDGQTGNVTEGETTRVQTDMVQRVVRKGTKPRVVETSIDFTTRYEKDGTKPKGENTEVVNGLPGKTITTTTYTLNPNNGNVTENPSTSRTEEPVTKVVKVGAKDEIEVTPIEMVTRYERDDELTVGKLSIVNAGKAGSITTTTTFDVNPKTGDVTESGKTSATDEMIERVIKVGTKPKVDVERRAVTIRYESNDQVDNGKRTVKSEGSETVVTTTTNYTLNKDGSTTPDTPIVSTVDGSDRVIEVGTKTKVVTLDLPFSVETQYDTTLEAGQTVTDQEGENGSRTITTTYTLNTSTGDVSSSTSEDLIPAKPKKLRIGIGVRTTNVRHALHEVQFETEMIEDRFLPKNTEIIENPGALGKDLETITEQMFNGEIKSSSTSTSRILEPVKRVVRVGTYEFDKPVENLTIDSPEYTEPVGSNDSDGEGNIIPTPIVEIPEYTESVGSNDSDGDGNTIPAPIVEILEFEGGVTPNEAPIHELTEFDGSVVPNESPIHEIPEYTEPIGSNDSDGEGNIIPAPIVEIPEYDGQIGVNPNDAPALEVPEYHEDAVPNDSLVLEVPEFNGSANPNEAPVLEIPEYDGQIGRNPNEAPVLEIPEFEGGVNPIDAPINDLTELKIDSEEPKRDSDQHKQRDHQINEKSEESKTLPNTGEKSSRLAALGVMSLIASAAALISKIRRSED